jgi:hypothetical protein
MHSEPEFWDDVVRLLPVCIELEENFEKIRKEFFLFASKNIHSDSKIKRFLNYPNLQIQNQHKNSEQSNLYSGDWNVCFAGTDASSSKEWGNYELLEKIVKWKTKISMNSQIDYAKSQFQTFNSIVENHADKGQCSGAVFSILKPGALIHPHNGSDNTMRCHMCIYGDDECTITVGNKTRTWTEGRILSFKDGPPYMHSVKHNGTKDRVVLIFNFDLDYLRIKFPEAKL